MAAKPLTPEQRQEIAKSLYLGVTPAVDKAYQNDPRTQLAQTLMATGASTAPVASGNWGIAEGLSRALSGGLGKFVSDRQRSKYDVADEDAQAALIGAQRDPLAAAIGKVAGQEQPIAPVQQPVADAVKMAAKAPMDPGAMAPVQPTPAVQQQAALPPRMGAMPPGAVQGVSLPPSAADQAMAVANPTPAPVPTMDRGAGFSANQRAQRPSVNTSQYFQIGIVPIEGGTDPKTGAFRTSPKGAIGPAQVMPGTAPEAAALAGLPYDERRYKTDAAYNLALGQAYYDAKVREFGGDAIKGAAAYNAGAGRVRRAVRSAAKRGGSYVDYLPAETQKYVQDFIVRTQAASPEGQANSGAGSGGSSAGGGSGSTGVGPAPQVAEAALPEAAAEVARPQLGDRVRSSRLAVAYNLLQQNPNMDTALLGSLMQPLLDKGYDEDQAAKMARDQDEFALAQTGYQSDLSRRNQMDTARYQALVDEFGNTRQFNRDLQRDQYGYGFQRSERLGGEAFRNANREDEQAFTAEQNRLAREAEYRQFTEELAASGQDKAADFWRLPTGAKLYKEAMDIANAGAGMAQTGRRVLSIADQFESGGLTRAGMSRDALAAYDSNIAELRALQKEAVTNKLGGKLGAGVSNADFAALSQATPIGPDTPPALLKREAGRMIALGQRSEDYQRSYLKYYGGDPQGLAENWAKYINEVPLYDSKGNIRQGGYIPYDEWLDFARKNGGVK